MSVLTELIWRLWMKRPGASQMELPAPTAALRETRGRAIIKHLQSYLIFIKS